MSKLSGLKDSRENDMRETLVVTLVGEEREDGTVYVHSPDIPAFHIIAPNRHDAPGYACKVLAEYLERNSGGTVDVRAPDSLEAVLGERAPASTTFPAHLAPSILPAHVIAEVTR